MLMYTVAGMWQTACFCVGEQVADASDNSLAHGGGGGNSYQRTCFYFLCIFNEKR